MSYLYENPSEVYVVTMYRFGDIENHSYILGVFSLKEKAELAGEIEEAWRGGKYKPAIKQLLVDQDIPKSQLDWWNECKQ